MRPLNLTMQIAVRQALQYIGEQWAYGQWKADYLAKQRCENPYPAQGA